jgi:hypothetical protein
VDIQYIPIMSANWTTTRTDCCLDQSLRMEKHDVGRTTAAATNMFLPLTARCVSLVRQQLLALRTLVYAIDEESAIEREQMRRWEE